MRHSPEKPAPRSFCLRRRIFAARAGSSFAFGGALRAMRLLPGKSTDGQTPAPRATSSVHVSALSRVACHATNNSNSVRPEQV
jgi:hypothetical protein